MIHIRLPYPPSTNAIWRAVLDKGGNIRNIKSEEYRSWLAKAAAEYLRTFPRPKMRGAYLMTLTADRPDNRRRDLSNLVKSAEDFLVSHQIVESDHLAQRIVLEWSDKLPAKPAFVNITLEPANKGLPIKEV